MLTEKQEIIGGINTDIFSHEIKSNLHIFILPGNPGISAFYTDFANQLIKNLNGKVNLYIISYAGFTKSKPEKNYSLQEELTHKVETINHFKTKFKWSKKSQIVFIGHSVGGWLTKELTKKFQTEFKTTTFLLFPFFTKSREETQISYEKLLNNTKYIKLSLGLYRIIKKIPEPMILSLTKLLYTHASDNAIKIILQFFITIKHIPESILYLAKSEFHTFTEEIDIDFFKKYHKSTHVFYCSDDLWAPLSQLKILNEKIPTLKTELIPLITHDFCVNTEQSKIVANKILEHLGK